MGKLVWGAALSGMMGVALAGDVLLIEKVEERMMRDLPQNGLTQAQVEARYGMPQEKRAPVGDPPITRWTYDDFNVYFEYDLVIDSVLHHDAIMREVEAQQEP
jgi:predicted RNA-binding protein